MKLNSQNLNHETLETIAAEAIAKLETSNRADRKRWQNAIRKGVSELRENCYWNYADGELVIMSTTSNAVYVLNGKYTCEAFARQMPCRHRSQKRLLDLYAEAT